MTNSINEGHIPGTIREREIYGLLPDFAIRRYVKITPYSQGEKRSGVISFGESSAGYDLRLGTRFKIFSPVNVPGLVVDPKNIDERAFHDHEGAFCVIPPNSYALAESMEYIEMPRDVMAIALGKSSYARTGVIANVTPIEPSWRGRLTIEISNSCQLPTKVYAGEGIVQLMFFRMMCECERDYSQRSNKYQDQVGITHARV